VDPKPESRAGAADLPPVWPPGHVPGSEHAYAGEECGCPAVPVVSQCKPNFGSDASSRELQSSASFHWEHSRSEWKMPARCFASRYPVTACAQTARKQFFLRGWGPDLDLSAAPSVRLCSVSGDNSSAVLLLDWHIPKYIILLALWVWLVLFRAAAANRTQCWVRRLHVISECSSQHKAEYPDILCLEAYN